MLPASDARSGLPISLVPKVSTSVHGTADEGKLGVDHRFLLDFDMVKPALCEGPPKLGSDELTLSYLCDNPLERVASGNKLSGPLDMDREIVSSSSEDVDPRAERNFLQLTGNRTSKREILCVNEEIETKGCEKKAKSEPFNLSLSLPDVSLSLASENLRLDPHMGAHSVQSWTPSNTRTCSDDFTASRSYSYSFQFSHSPSCSLARHPMEGDYSNGSHRRDNDQSWYCGEGTNGSVHSRFKPVTESTALSYHPHTNFSKTLFRPTNSENHSNFPSELPARPKKDATCVDSAGKKHSRLESRPDKILREIASEPVPTIAQILQQEILPETLENVKDHLKNLMKWGKTEEFGSLQQLVQSRSDLTFETLSKCSKNQLDLLVTIKTGIANYISGKTHLPSNELIEIFLQSRCKNIDCKNLLPVDDCDCKICSMKKGFCSSCMCPVCMNFDCAANTCSWVGCDVCLHWCHAMCGIQMNLIKPGPCPRGDARAMEMQFNCLGCGHASELFGFVKEVFTCCASDWGMETLLKELECVQHIFCGSVDIRGIQLHRKAEQMLHRLQKRTISSSEASNEMLQFFNYGATEYSASGKCSKELGKETGLVLDAEAGLPSNLTRSGASPVAQADTLQSTDERKNAHLPTEKRFFETGSGDQKASHVDSLETMIRIKEAEARMFQRKADDAEREAEGYRQLVRAKTEKIEEEHAKSLAKLCLQETEERRRTKLEELKMLESSHCDYYKMKLRMEAEIAGLLQRMETTKRQWA